MYGLIILGLSIYPASVYPKIFRDVAELDVPRKRGDTC